MKVGMHSRHLISPTLRHGLAHAKLAKRPNEPNFPDHFPTEKRSIISQTNPIPRHRPRHSLARPVPCTPAKRKIPNEPNFDPSKKKTKHIRFSQRTRFRTRIASSGSPFPHSASASSPSLFATRVFPASLIRWRHLRPRSKHHATDVAPFCVTPEDAVASASGTPLTESTAFPHLAGLVPYTPQDILVVQALKTSGNPQWLK